MIITAIAKRYARALFELAQEEKRVDAVLEEFKAFLALIEKEKELQLLLKLPNAIQREKFLTEFLKATYSELFFNFLVLVLKNNRFAILREILGDYQAKYDKLKNRIRAVVITAVPLDSKLSAKLAQQLKDYYQAEVTIENRIDPSILGGVIVNVNGHVFNASVLEKFKKLKMYLTKN